LTIVWAIGKPKPCLKGYHFKVVGGYKALKRLYSIESPSGRIARWALRLKRYDFEIAFRKDQLNVVADTFSRQLLRHEGDNGANGFRGLQLDQGHVRQDICVNKICLYYTSNFSKNVIYTFILTLTTLKII